ncbi:unnamed protein product [Durusdinium trenchii]|uniref:Uncharacterized protein n=1 Tax=Durusdinium trenchii TaxID=1381693 RepID=A0ABP0Q8E8_9DINO
MHYGIQSLLFLLALGAVALASDRWVDLFIALFAFPIETGKGLEVGCVFGLILVLLALEDVTKPIFGFLPQLQRSERADNVQIERFRTQDGYVARYLSAGSVVIFRSSLTQGLFAQSLRRTFLRFSVSARHSLAEATERTAGEL